MPCLRAAEALSASFICLFPTVSMLSCKCGKLQTLSFHVSRKAGDFEEHTLSHTLSCHCLNIHTTPTQHTSHTPVCLEDTQRLFYHTCQHEHTHAKVSYLFGCLFMVRNTLSDHGKAAVAQQKGISSMML